MPCPFGEWHELYELSIAPDKQMGRDFQAPDLAEVLVTVPVQRIGKQSFDFRATELARRQADAVQDDEINIHTRGARILVGAGTLPRRFHEPGVAVDLNHS